MILQQIVQSELSVQLSWIFLHSLWQLSLLGLLTVIFSGLISRHSKIRYRFLYIILLLMAVTPMVTFILMGVPQKDSSPVAMNQPMEAIHSDVVASSGNSKSLSALRNEFSESPQNHNAGSSSQRAGETPPQQTSFSGPVINQSLHKVNMNLYSGWITPLWITGIFFLALKQVGGWILSRQVLKNSSVMTDEYLLERIHEIARAMGVQQMIRIMESSTTYVPLVVGSFRPVLVIPVSMITGVTPAQFDALIAHEVAHIRRYDFFLNLIQMMIETVFFYHPAIWWISRQVRTEREYCCDDMATRYCRGSLPLAEALAAIEQSRTNSMDISLAMTALGEGKPESTYRRIKRILNREPHKNRIYSGWLVASFVFIMLIAVGFAGHWSLFANEDDARIVTEDLITEKAPEKNISEKNEITLSQPEEKKESRPESWEITKIYGKEGLADWLNSHLYLPNPVEVPAVRAHVYDNNGIPAVNAVVHSFTPRRSAKISFGGFQKLGPRQPQTMTDRNGKFGLPKRKEPYHVLITHPTGMAVVSHEDLLNSRGKVTLKEWGNLRGRVLLNNVPQANQEVYLNFDTEEWSYKNQSLRSDYRTLTNSSGGFSFRNIPPVSGTVYAAVGNGDDTDKIKSDISFSGTHDSRNNQKKNIYAEKFTCKPGENIHVEIGRGRTIQGKIKVPDDKFHVDWSQVNISIIRMISKPPYPEELLKSNDLKAIQSYVPPKERNGKQEKHVVVSLVHVHGTRLQSDGSFVIHGLKPGRYSIGASIPIIFSHAQKEFLIDQSEGDSIDLGELELTHNQQLKEAQLNPPKSSWRLGVEPSVPAFQDGF